VPTPGEAADDKGVPNEAIGVCTCWGVSPPAAVTKEPRVACGVCGKELQRRFGKGENGRGSEIHTFLQQPRKSHRVACGVCGKELQRRFGRTRWKRQ